MHLEEHLEECFYCSGDKMAISDVRLMKLQVLSGLSPTRCRGRGGRRSLLLLLRLRLRLRLTAVDLERHFITHQPIAE